MKILESQAEYVKKRGNKDYNLKYSILKFIIEKNINSKSKVLELFGGIGLTSYLISLKNPKIHTIIDLNQDCINILNKRFKNVEKADAFNYIRLNGYQFIFLDSNGFTLKRQEQFNKLFNNIKNLNSKATLILTETGIYNTIFSKEEPEKYYARLNKFFIQNYEFYIKEVYYTRKFAILVLKQYPEVMELIFWDKQLLNWEDLKGG